MKGLIRLCGCAGWSALLLFTTLETDGEAYNPIKWLNIKTTFAVKLADTVYVILINVKMVTIVAILTLMSIIMSLKKLFNLGMWMLGFMPLT